MFFENYLTFRLTVQYLLLHKIETMKTICFGKFLFFNRFSKFLFFNHFSKLSDEVLFSNPKF